MGTLASLKEICCGGRVLGIDYNHFSLTMLKVTLIMLKFNNVKGDLNNVKVACHFGRSRPFEPAILAGRLVICNGMSLPFWQVKQTTTPMYVKTNKPPAKMAGRK